jgi:hypothetical protein
MIALIRVERDRLIQQDGTSSNLIDCQCVRGNGTDVSISSLLSTFSIFEQEQFACQA